MLLVPLQGSWELMQTLIATEEFKIGGLSEKMGVFVGIQQMEYTSLASAHLRPMGAFAATGNPFSVAAGRISFHYGLNGALRITKYYFHKLGKMQNANMIMIKESFKTLSKPHISDLTIKGMV